MPSIAVKRLSSVSDNQKQVTPEKDRQSEFIRVRELELDPNLYNEYRKRYHCCQMGIIFSNCSLSLTWLGEHKRTMGSGIKYLKPDRKTPYTR